MVDDDIPMNAGCLRPIRIVIPPRSMLSPEYPAAVVAGNVEVSQAVTDTLFGALGAMAAAQGTMNNLTFGNDRYQYYETICSGAPAGPGFDGADAVHTHMTNSRLTDPEILEFRYPGGAGGFPHPPGVGRARALACGRRHPPHHPFPRADGMRDPLRPSPRAAFRPRGRRGRPGRRERGAPARRARRDAARLRRHRAGGRRGGDHPDADGGGYGDAGDRDDAG